MAEIAAVFNPTAGRGRARQVWPELARQLNEAGIEVHTIETTRPGEEEQITVDLYNQGQRRFLSVGGDGTLHNIVKVLGGTEATLGIIPAGSGNDMSRTLGIEPGRPETALRSIIDNRVKRIDLGKANGSWFINAAGCGFDAEVAQAANTWGKKYFHGKVGYIAAVLTSFVSFPKQELHITLDGRPIEHRGWLAAVCNGQWFGGGMHIAPNAQPDDGLFDLVIVGDISRIGLLQAFPTIFTGEHVKNPYVHLYQARRVRIETSGNAYIQAEGEPMGRGALDCELVPAALGVYA
jgi:YegS/Rv2252/BmrU family lipid kinase